MSMIEYSVIEQVEMESGELVSLIDINMMSDERWNQLAEEQAVKNFRRRYGREPESVQEALESQRAFIRGLERGDAV